MSVTVALLIVLRHQVEGLQVSAQDKETAIKNINEDAAKHGLTGIKIAMEHMKGMGQNGMMGIRRALNYVNETSTENNGPPTTPANPVNPSTPAIPGTQGTPANPGAPVTPAIPAQPPNQGSHGPPTFPGQSGLHEKH